MQYYIIQFVSMGRRMIACVVCLFFVTGILFAKSLVLTLGDGTRVYYQLGGDVNPMLRFVDGGIVVNADRYEFGDVKNFYVSAEDAPNGIEQIVGDVPVKYGSGIVIFDTDASLSVRVYSSNGSGMDVSPRQVGGRIVVDLSPLPQGAYIVTVGETALKIFKK